MRSKVWLALLGSFGLAMMPAPGLAAIEAHNAAGQAAPAAHIVAGHRTWIAAAVSVNLFSKSNGTGGASVAHRSKPFLQPPVIRTPVTHRAPVASVAAP